MVKKPIALHCKENEIKLRILLKSDYLFNYIILFYFKIELQF